MELDHIWQVREKIGAPGWIWHCMDIIGEHSPASWAHIKYFRCDEAGPYLTGGWGESSGEDIALHESYGRTFTIKYFTCDGAGPQSGTKPLKMQLHRDWISPCAVNQLRQHQSFQLWRSWYYIRLDVNVTGTYFVDSIIGPGIRNACMARGEHQLANSCKLNHYGDWLRCWWVETGFTWWVYLVLIGTTSKMTFCFLIKF